jgi:predicted nucleic acid-binding protein
LTEVFLADVPLLQLTDAVNVVAKAIMESGLLPQKATRDAIHIAVASVHGIDFLLTWNCRHIANAEIMKELHNILANCGCDIPTICTPEELFGA